MRRLSIKSSVWIHVFAWILFIGYEMPIAELWDTTSGLDEFALFYLLDICLFYFNAEIIVRYAVSKEKILLVLIPVMLLELLVFFALGLGTGILLYKIQHHWEFYAVTDKDCVKALYRGIYIMGFSSGYGFFRRALKAVIETNQIKILQLETEHRRMEMEKEKVKAENAYLQAQINRHLLFNMLNFIYSSVSQTAPKAGQIVMLLSETMQYAMRDRESQMVPLSDEIEQIEKYIFLMELRFPHRLRLTVHVEIGADCRNVKIPPLLLLTFIENIFKHGDLASYPEDARIFISCANNLLYLHTENFKKGWKPPLRKSIGIINARTRLESNYGPSNFDLNLSDADNKFIVDLNIRL